MFLGLFFSFTSLSPFHCIIRIIPFIPLADAKTHKMLILLNIPSHSHLYSYIFWWTIIIIIIIVFHYVLFLVLFIQFYFYLRGDRGISQCSIKFLSFLLLFESKISFPLYLCLFLPKNSSFDFFCFVFHFIFPSFYFLYTSKFINWCVLFIVIFCAIFNYNYTNFCLN